VTSDIGDVTRVPERDILDLPLPVGSLPGTRREQLKNYIKETWFWAVRHVNDDESIDDISLATPDDISVAFSACSI
jgi:hypothetical protein